MRTTEERLEQLHQRVEALNQKREATWRRGLGGASAAMALCLFALIGVMGKGGHGIDSAGYAGTSILAESVGGYVLVAVVAFFLGAVIAVLLRRHRRKAGRD